jgi:hypothetical protein
VAPHDAIEVLVPESAAEDPHDDAEEFRVVVRILRQPQVRWSTWRGQRRAVAADSTTNAEFAEIQRLPTRPG